MDKRVIEIRDLWFSYDQHLVLQNVSLDVEEREFLAILGPNGGGKTTLLKLMLGILTPDRGSIRVLGKDPRQVAERIGYVPQDLNFTKGFPITVQEVVLMGRLGHVRGVRQYSMRDREIAEDALLKVRMGDCRHRQMEQLSGGQRQRVFIARALASDPEVLFMDEPTAGVDTQFHTEMYEFLRGLNEKMTILVVSHDISVLSSYVKSVACVNRTLYHHHAAEITSEMLDKAYHCPVELVAHGVPHRVLRDHGDQ